MLTMIMVSFYTSVSSLLKLIYGSTGVTTEQPLEAPKITGDLIVCSTTCSGSQQQLQYSSSNYQDNPISSPSCIVDWHKTLTHCNLINGWQFGDNGLKVTS